MASESVAVNNGFGVSFCTAVQKCSYGKCRSNGTHHLKIETVYSDDGGQECIDVIDSWYCDKHYKKLINSN